ncbi:MAG: response regulator [Alphaproteobacteria bacterium]|jgi:DNA-binding response OmpR family regulator|nr:response regulator [Alphaproteobacteria bacterium]MDP6515096.1 response regulator [Alphaproteobacteria bacterium]
MLQKIDFSRISFLVVDDNQLSSEVLRDILTTLGADKIRRCPDSDAAIDILGQGDIDVLIAEWNIGPLNGLELIEWVRHSVDSPNRMLPVIMVTANSAQEYVIRARDQGVTEFLAKPYSGEQIFGRLVSVIARPRQFVNADGYFGPDRRRRQLRHDGPDRRRKAS